MGGKKFVITTLGTLAVLIFSYLFIISEFSWKKTSPTFAAAKTWAGGSTGVWEDGSNWSPTGVPTAADDVTINNATVTLSLGQTANFNTLTLGTGGTTELILSGNIGTGGSITIPVNGTLTQDNTTQQILSGNLIIDGGGFTHSANTGATQDHIINLKAQNITVTNVIGTGIEASGQGYQPQGLTLAGFGPGGGGGSTGGAGAGGGGHYGAGGNGGGGALGGNSYCDISNIATMGSAGGTDDVTSTLRGGYGGGLIILEANDTFTLNGRIRATGVLARPGSNAGGGAGGGIKITAGSLAGTPQLFWFGGGNGNGTGGGAGGGCAFLKYKFANTLSISTSSLFLDGGLGAHTGAAGTLSFFQIPSAIPLNPTSSLITTSSVKLDWAPGNGAETFYQVEQSLDGITYSFLATTSLATTSLSVIDLAPNTHYWFRVAGANGFSTSSFATFSPLYTEAFIPDDLTLESSTDDSATLSWDGEGTNFFIEDETSKINSGWISNHSYTFEHLLCGTAFSFHARARNGSLVPTDYSSSISFTTPACTVVSVPATFAPSFIPTSSLTPSSSIPSSTAFYDLPFPTPSTSSPLPTSSSFSPTPSAVSPPEIPPTSPLVVVPPTISPPVISFFFRSSTLPVSAPLNIITTFPCQTITFKITAPSFPSSPRLFFSRPIATPPTSTILEAQSILGSPTARQSFLVASSSPTSASTPLNPSSQQNARSPYFNSSTPTSTINNFSTSSLSSPQSLTFFLSTTTVVSPLISSCAVSTSTYQFFLRPSGNTAQISFPSPATPDTLSTAQVRSGGGTPETLKNSSFSVQTVPFGQIFRDEPNSSEVVALFSENGTLVNTTPFHQPNPQRTVEHQFAWNVPNGRYFIRVTTPDEAWQTPVFTVRTSLVNPKIILPISHNTPLVSSPTTTPPPSSSPTSVLTLMVTSSRKSTSSTSLPLHLGFLALLLAGLLSLVPSKTLFATLRLIFLTPLFADRSKFTISGIVVNAFNQHPLDLATVKLLDAKSKKILQTTVTGHEGSFSFAPPQSKGEYMIVAYKDGFNSSTIQLTRTTNRSIVFSLTQHNSKEVSRAVVRLSRFRYVELIISGCGLLALISSLSLTPTVWYLWLLVGCQLLISAFFIRAGFEHSSPSLPRSSSKASSVRRKK